nr:hypothetical protein [Pandoravirus massiliensis]
MYIGGLRAPFPSLVLFAFLESFFFKKMLKRQHTNNENREKKNHYAMPPFFSVGPHKAAVHLVDGGGATERGHRKRLAMFGVMALASNLHPLPKKATPGSRVHERPQRPQAFFPMFSLFARIFWHFFLF